MILKRQEKDNIVKALYDSSNILASIYDTANNDLNLIFKGGRKYKYANVSKSDYMRFEIAESQGDVFNTHIKKYSFERLEDVDPSKIITEAENLKADEKKALLEGLKNKIDKLVVLNSSYTNFSEEYTEYLTSLVEAAQNYLTELKKED
jgi:hypothetical protein